MAPCSTASSATWRGSRSTATIRRRVTLVSGSEPHDRAHPRPLDDRIPCRHEPAGRGLRRTLGRDRVYGHRRRRARPGSRAEESQRFAAPLLGGWGEPGQPAFLEFRSDGTFSWGKGIGGTLHDARFQHRCGSRSCRTAGRRPPRPRLHHRRPPADAHGAGRRRHHLSARAVAARPANRSAAVAPLRGVRARSAPRAARSSRRDAPAAGRPPRTRRRASAWRRRAPPDARPARGTARSAAPGR